MKPQSYSWRLSHNGNNVPLRNQTDRGVIDSAFTKQPTNPSDLDRTKAEILYHRKSLQVLNALKPCSTLLIKSIPAVAVNQSPLKTPHNATCVCLVFHYRKWKVQFTKNTTFHFQRSWKRIPPAVPNLHFIPHWTQQCDREESGMWKLHLAKPGVLFLLL